MAAFASGVGAPLGGTGAVSASLSDKGSNDVPEEDDLLQVSPQPVSVCLFWGHIAIVATF